ncbi:hypothetical protein [Serratia ureilytica]|uniref:hypothetical protein n=1 Tax=Serratia ureilytica TaxID=300181 RepID=UPI003CFE83A1
MKEIISPVDTEDGLFHDGDPSTGTEGTVVSQKWLNPVQGAVISSQEEMASVLKEAGIKIDPTKQDQLLAAIKKITGTATEGYLKVGDYGFGGGPKHKADAYNNIGEFYRVNGSSKNTPTTGVAGVVSLPCDGGPSTAYISVSNAGNAWVGFSSVQANGVKWNRLYTDANKPTAADINVYTKQEADGRFAFKSITVNGKPLSSNVNLTAGDVNAWNKTEADGRFIFKTGGTMTGQLIAPSVATTAGATPWGAGPFSEQLNNQAPFFQPNWQWPVTAGGIYAPIAKGVVTRQGQGYPTAVSFGYLLNGTPSFAIPCIHAKGDNIDVNWRFDPNTGQFYSPGNILASGAILHTDGNITGNIWGGYLSNWLNSNISNAQNGAQNWAYQNLVQNVRLSGRINQPDTGGQVRVPDGCVFTGVSGANYNPSIWASYSYIQVLINGTWRNIGTS